MKEGSCKAWWWYLLSLFSYWEKGGRGRRRFDPPPHPTPSGLWFRRTDTFPGPSRGWKEASSSAHRDLIYIEMTSLCWSTWMEAIQWRKFSKLWWTWQVWLLSFLCKISGEDVRKIKQKPWHVRRHCNVSRFSGTYMFICHLISSIEMPRF